MPRGCFIPDSLELSYVLSHGVKADTMEQWWQVVQGGITGLGVIYEIKLNKEIEDILTPIQDVSQKEARFIELMAVRLFLLEKWNAKSKVFLWSEYEKFAAILKERENNSNPETVIDTEIIVTSFTLFDNTSADVEKIIQDAANAQSEEIWWMIVEYGLATVENSWLKTVNEQVKGIIANVYEARLRDFYTEFETLASEDENELLDELNTLNEMFSRIKVRNLGLYVNLVAGFIETIENLNNPDLTDFITKLNQFKDDLEGLDKEKRRAREVWEASSGSFAWNGFADYLSITNTSQVENLATRAFDPDARRVQRVISLVALSMSPEEWWEKVTYGMDSLAGSVETQIYAEINQLLLGKTDEEILALKEILDKEKDAILQEWKARAQGYLLTEFAEYLEILKLRQENPDTEQLQEGYYYAGNGVWKEIEGDLVLVKDYYEGFGQWIQAEEVLANKRTYWDITSMNTINNGITEWREAITSKETEKILHLYQLTSLAQSWQDRKEAIDTAEQNTRDRIVAMISSIPDNVIDTTTTTDDTTYYDAQERLDEMIENVTAMVRDNTRPLSDVAIYLAAFFNDESIFAAGREADHEANIIKERTEYKDAPGMTFSQVVGSTTISCSAKNMIDPLANAYHTCGGQPSNTSGSINILTDKNLSITGTNLLADSQCTKSTVSAIGSKSYNCWYDILESVRDSSLDEPYKISCKRSEKKWDFKKNWRNLNESVCVEWNYDTIPGYRDEETRITFTVTHTMDKILIDNIPIDKATINQNIINAINGSWYIPYTPANFEGWISRTNTITLYSNAQNKTISITDKDNLEFGGVSVTTEYIYNYRDLNTEANRDLWQELKNNYADIASEWSNMEDDLEEFQDNKASFETEYNTAMTEIYGANFDGTLSANDQSKSYKSQEENLENGYIPDSDELDANYGRYGTALLTYNSSIRELETKRDGWLWDIYGGPHEFYTDTFANKDSFNPDSEYNSGNTQWDNKENELSEAKKKWYLEAIEVLRDSYELIDPQTNELTGGEAKFINESKSQLETLKGDIVSSEENTIELMDKASNFWQGIDFNTALEMVIRAILNKENEVSLNSFGISLSNEVMSSLDRARVLKETEAKASAVLNELGESIDISQLFSKIAELAMEKINQQNEIDGTNSGFGYTVRKDNAASQISEFTLIKEELERAKGIKDNAMEMEVRFLDEARNMLIRADDYLKRSKELELAGDFENAKKYWQLGIDKKDETQLFLNQKYSDLIKFIGDDILAKGLTFTTSPMEKYIDILKGKNLQSIQDMDEEISSLEKEKQGLIDRGAMYDEALSLIDESMRLSRQSTINQEKINELLSQAKELAGASVSGDLLSGINEEIAAIFNSLPGNISTDSGAADALAAINTRLARLWGELREMQGNLNETTLPDLSVLDDMAALMQDSSNLAVKGTIMRYLDESAVKLREFVDAQNDSRSVEMLNDLMASAVLKNPICGESECTGFTFGSLGGDNGLIEGTRIIFSGRFTVKGNVTDEISYSPLFTEQRFTLESKFDLPTMNIEDVYNASQSSNMNISEMVEGVFGQIISVFDNQENLISNLEALGSTEQMIDNAFTDSKNEDAAIAEHSFDEIDNKMATWNSQGNSIAIMIMQKNIAAKAREDAFTSTREMLIGKYKDLESEDAVGSGCMKDDEITFETCRSVKLAYEYWADGMRESLNEPLITAQNDSGLSDTLAWEHGIRYAYNFDDSGVGRRDVWDGAYSYSRDHGSAMHPDSYHPDTTEQTFTIAKDLDRTALNIEYEIGESSDLDVIGKYTDIWDDYQRYSTTLSDTVMTTFNENNSTMQFNASLYSREVGYAINRKEDERAVIGVIADITAVAAGILSEESVM